MKAKIHLVVTISIALSLIAGMHSAGAGAKSLLEELGLPQFPGTKLLTEVNMPDKGMLSSMMEGMGPMLGIVDVKQVFVAGYSLDSKTDAENVFKFYEPSLSDHDWKFVIRSLDREDSTAILSNEKNGILIITMDSPGDRERELTIMHIVGKIDPSKITKANAKLPDMLSGMVTKATSSIPIDQPIHVPPAESLQVKATRSDIKARILDNNTAELRVGLGTNDPGKLARNDDDLVMTLTPKLDVEMLTLPGTIPTRIELTEGSLKLSGGPGPNDRPVKLTVTSTGAPVTFEHYSLVSGTHTVKVDGSDAQIVLSQACGGNLEVEIIRGDLTLTLPKDASAQIDISAPSLRIENRTGVEPAKSSADSMTIRMGSGKTAISVHAVNGNVSIKTD